MMRDPYKWCLTVVLGLAAVMLMSAPAGAVAVSACGDFASSNPNDTRFDLTQSITYTGSGTCLNLPENAVLYLNGFVLVGPGLDSETTGIVIGNNSFVLGPGVVRGFSTCLFGGNDVAVETVLFNQCGFGIFLGESYKVKEVRIHDCTPSSLFGIGMLLGQGGFMESSIVRACDYGVITGANNKIWNLVVTRHTFRGLWLLAAGNAVSRTVISHPRSTSTIGLDYTNCGTNTGTTANNTGCQDGSNSVSGHVAGNNVILPGGTTTSAVVTQSSDLTSNSATNCNGSGVGRRDGPTGHFVQGAAGLTSPATGDPAGC